MFQKIKQIASLLLPKNKSVPVETQRHPLDSLVDSQERKVNAYLTTSAPPVNSQPKQEESMMSVTEISRQTPNTPSEPIMKEVSQPLLQLQEPAKPKKQGSNKTQTKSKPKSKKPATQKQGK